MGFGSDDIAFTREPKGKLWEGHPCWTAINPITKPPESGELFVEITKFVVAEDLPPPQTKYSPHTAHQMMVVLFLYLTKENPILDLNPKQCDIVFIMKLISSASPSPSCSGH